MIKRLTFVLCFLIYALSVSGQSKGTLRGYVIDEKTGEAIISAYVLDKENRRGTTTDREGFFQS